MAFPGIRHHGLRQGPPVLTVSGHGRQALIAVHKDGILGPGNHARHVLQPLSGCIHHAAEYNVRPGEKCADILLGTAPKRVVTSHFRAVLQRIDHAAVSPALVRLFPDYRLVGVQNPGNIRRVRKSRVGARIAQAHGDHIGFLRYPVFQIQRVQVRDKHTPGENQGDDAQP